MSARRFLLSLLVCLFLLPAFVGCGKEPESSPIIAFYLEDDTVTVAQADSALLRLLHRLSVNDPFWQNPTPDKLRSHRRKSINDMVYDAIVEQGARRRGIVIDSARVATAYDTLFSKRFKKKTEVLERLLDRKKLTFQDFLAGVRKQLVYEALVDSLVKPVGIPDDSLMKYYKSRYWEFMDVKRKVSHICFYKKLSFTDDSEKKLRLLDAILKERDSTLAGERLERARQAEILREKKKIHKLRRKISRGAGFAKLSRAFSEDTSYHQSGGFINRPIPLGYRHPPYSDTAFSLKTGRISPVIETAYGFFIIRADSDPETTFTSFEEAAPRLRRSFDKEKRETVFREYWETKRPVVVMDTSKPPLYILKEL